MFLCVVFYFFDFLIHLIWKYTPFFSKVDQIYFLTKYSQNAPERTKLNVNSKNFLGVAPPGPSQGQGPPAPALGLRPRKSPLFLNQNPPLKIPATALISLGKRQNLITSGGEKVPDRCQNFNLAPRRRVEKKPWKKTCRKKICPPTGVVKNPGPPIPDRE